MSDGKLALRNMWFRNKVTNEVMEITIEGSESVVLAFADEIRRLVLASWVQVEASPKVE